MAKKLLLPSEQVRSPSNLWSAWRQVYRNGIRSKSEETKDDVLNFSSTAEKSINRINRQLRSNKYIFSPARGVPIARSGKSPRPIVVSTIPDRIVSRSILDTLQNVKELKPYFLSKFSFGGIKDVEKDIDRGVSGALLAVNQAIEVGATYYLRSDIESFFTKIPKKAVIDTVSKVIGDENFINLLERAISVELENLEELGSKSELFPLFDIGVAQGCCLSPLLGNILLSEFDYRMNSEDVTCLRYIDDFLILGKSESSVRKAFNRAINLLGTHDLTAYDPKVNSQKAETGEIKNGFNFLGCKYVPGLISPDRKSRSRLLFKVDDLIGRSLDSMKNPNSCKKRGLSLVATMNSLNNLLQGWGNQYSFCNNKQLMDELDTKIDEKIKNYLSLYKLKKDSLQGKDRSINRRRLLGIHNVGADSKKKPIIK